MCRRNGCCVLVLAVFLFFANALPSVPVATDPILVTATVPTVVPSLVTVYSVVPATDAAPNVVTTVTTTTDGTVTTLTSTAAIAGLVTSTIISTIYLSTSQVVVSTIGFSTVFGPDPTTPAASSILETTLSTSATLVTSSTAPLISETVLTTSLGEQTNSLVAATASSSKTTLSVSSPSSSTTAVGANGSSTASSSPSHAKGLSNSAKAGIGIGVAIVVILLVALSFLLGQWVSRRRNQMANAEFEEHSAQEKDTFRAGRPYETTGIQHSSPAFAASKAHAYSMNTTAVGSSSPSVGRQSFDAPNSPPRNSHYDDAELSALPPVTKQDDQMYVGVPTHMSGSKRWSMKEFMK